jgi:serpin B
MKAPLALSVSTCFFMSLTAAACVPSPPSPSDEPPRVQAARSVNSFGLDLYSRLSPKPGNLIYSPYSISTALAMTGAGARGQTWEQIAQVFHLSGDVNGMAGGYHDLMHDLGSPGRPRQFQLFTANALWPQKEYPFHAAYLDLVRNRFGANAQPLDYIADADQARRTINAWVAEQTRNKIPELFPVNSLGSDTRLVLTNAIYFKADWAHAFDKKATSPQDFYRDAQTTVKVPLMFQQAELAYQETADYQAIELPYKDGDVAMLVILPKKKDGLAALEKSLPQELLRHGLAHASHKQVAVHLPKFKISSEFKLNSTLSAMGMPLAFSGGADFSGMSDERLSISLVIHKAVIEVDEEGTVAAAATGVVMKEAAAISDQPVSFTADHPFLFALRDRRTGCILFMGRVVNPQS